MNVWSGKAKNRWLLITIVEKEFAGLAESSSMEFLMVRFPPRLQIMFAGCKACHKAQPARPFAHLRLLHFAERKQCTLRSGEMILSFIENNSTKLENPSGTGQGRQKSSCSAMGVWWVNVVTRRSCIHSDRTDRVPIHRDCEKS